MVIGVAKKMKACFGNLLELHFRTAGDEHHERYRLKGKINVVLDDEVIPFHIAISESRMKAFLDKRLAE